MAFTLDLTKEELNNAQGGGFSALPAGTYGAQIYDIKQGESKSSGNPMWTVTWKITDGSEGINRRLRGYYLLKGKALFRTVELLKALDRPYPSRDSGKQFEFPEAEELLGEQANIQLTIRVRQTVDADGKDSEVEENNVGRVTAYDPDAVSGEDDSDSGLFLS